MAKELEPNDLTGDDYSECIEESPATGTSSEPSLVLGRAKNLAPSLVDKPTIQRAPENIYRNREVITGVSRSDQTSSTDANSLVIPTAGTAREEEERCDNSEHVSSSNLIVSRSLSSPSKDSDPGIIQPGITIYSPANNKFSTEAEEKQEHFPLSISSNKPVVHSDSPHSIQHASPTPLAQPSKNTHSLPKAANLKSSNITSKAYLASSDNGQLSSIKNRSSSNKSRNNHSSQNEPRVSPHAYTHTQPTTDHPMPTSYGHPTVSTTTASTTTATSHQHDSAQSTSLDSIPPYLVYSETDPDYQPVKIAAECLHAQDYPKMAHTLESAPSTIPVLFGRGLAYYKLTKYSHAKKEFEEILQRSENDPNLKGNVYLSHYYIGEIDLGHHRYEQASQRFELSARAFCKHTLAKRYRIIPPSEAVLYSKKGSALNHSKKVMAAIDSYKKAISLSITTKDKLAACTSLGNLYQSLGNNEEARKQYEETIKLAEELGDFIYLGWAHGNMGNAYLGLFQKDKALFHLEKSLDLTVKNEPSPQAIGRAYNNLGTAYQSLGDVLKAEEYYDLALSQAIYGRDTGGQARAYGNIGNLLMIQKKYKSAILHYTEAMGIGKDASTTSTAHHNRGCASYEKGEADKKSFFERYNASIRDSSSPLEELPSLTYHGPNVRHLPQAPSHLPSSIQSLFEQGRDDLMKVVNVHEETIQTIKGSTQGLTLSVSVSETNSRTFHRLQDCLFNLGEWDKALESAEQSRARSLGELMLQRKGHSLDLPLKSPLSTEQINHILDRVNKIVVYMSFTGSRLLVWVFAPVLGYITTNSFQVNLSDEQFDGKSFDYYLRYSLSEILIESNMEMYSVTTYEERSPLTVLFDLIGEPLLNILDSVYTQSSATEPKDVILILDSYTSLMPLVAFLNHKSQCFLGDRYRFHYMPSLLTMGILCQLPEIVVEVLEESCNFCIVGNPSIPTFSYQGETLSLGKLPHATKEAEWVSHILRCNPTLHDQATKMLIISMLNTAKVVHLATHGSVTGFLAFAGRGSSRNRDVADDKMVLLYPEEVEKLSISTALVVLSSCDSGRGVVKADGIQGMARAFILAGAQSVLTSLWRVPDESASTFMQFFYQYLMEGFVSSMALQKAILSVRAFSKYSQYIHWSGYQLTGREVRLVAKRSVMDNEVQGKVGVTAVFPRLHVINKLEEELVKAKRSPTDVQLIHGVNGLKPSEPVIDFITKYHSHFTGGIFWVNGTSPEFIRAAETQIQKVLLSGPSQAMEPTLVVLDNFSSLPEPGVLFNLLRSTTTHIIILTHTLTLPDQLRKQVDVQLIRGLNVLPLKPMSRLHSTQRIVHSIVCEHEFAPLPREQKILADIADKVGGSPTIVDLTAALLKRCVLGKSSIIQTENDFLNEFSIRVLKDEENVTITQFTSNLINGFQLSKSEYLLLTTLSVFGPVPIPKSVVEKVQSYVMLAKPTSEAPGSLMPVSNLINARLLLVYPAPVIAPPTKSTNTKPYTKPRILGTDSTEIDEESDYFYVPQLIKDALIETMTTLDEGVAITTAHKSLEQLYLYSKEPSFRLMGGGLSRMLIELMELRDANTLNNKPLNSNCFQELVGLYFNLRIQS